MAAGGVEHHRSRQHSKWRQRLHFVVEEKTWDRLCYTYLVFMVNLKDMFALAEDDDEEGPDDDWAAAMRDLPLPGGRRLGQNFATPCPVAPHSSRWEPGCTPSPTTSGHQQRIHGLASRPSSGSADRGTYSFDTAARRLFAWRKEGDWPLPCHERGLFVPELGLCFGLCPHRYCLCAFDLPGDEGNLPATRYAWQEESFPRECKDWGFHVQSLGSLAYLGDGKFCITWTVVTGYDEQGVPSRFALFLMAVQVVRCARRPPREVAAAQADDRDGELRLVKHKVRCYKMSPRGINGYVLQPSLG
ncbi:hypothetical protein QOZ80_8BG0666740 [Eleusine coracana subsp. coracana]|nr:hypothetical protein QOZ80_8BG0666740 [Eleusine coracana subsp. coracana]